MTRFCFFSFRRVVAVNLAGAHWLYAEKVAVFCYKALHWTIREQGRDRFKSRVF